MKLSIAPLLINLALAGLAMPCSPAAAQCCGDCDRNGVVDVSELISSVRAALNGCDFAPKPRLALRNVRLYGFNLLLDRPALEGRLALTVAMQSGGDSVFFLLHRENSYDVQVGLVRTGDTLRFYVDDRDGELNAINVDTSGWGATDAHTIETRWGRGNMTMTVDGIPSEQVPIGEVVVPSYSKVTIGNPKRSDGQDVPLFSDIAFATD